VYCHRELLRPSALGLRILSSIVFAAALIVSTAPAPADTVPVTVGGPFMLTEPDGTTVTDRTYRGKWLLVFFGYATCPDTCPATLNEIAIALEKLGPDAKRIQALFITVDPERDTPETLKRYTATFDTRIVGLTGSPQQIAAVAEEYGAYGAAHRHKAGAQDYLVDHSTYIYFMDPQGKFVRGFDARTPGDRIADTARKIMAQ